jgi:hypothetical protein
MFLYIPRFLNEYHKRKKVEHKIGRTSGKIILLFGEICRATIFTYHVYWKRTLKRYLFPQFARKRNYY